MGEEWVARIPVVHILPDRILNVLAGQWILEFRREERDPVQEQHQVKALLGLRAVTELPHDREQVRGVEPSRLLVEPTRRPEVRQLEPTPRILDARAEHIEDAAPLKFLRKALAESLPNLGPVVLLQPRPGARLRGDEEVDDVLWKQAKFPVVVGLELTPPVAPGREAVAVRR